VRGIIDGHIVLSRKVAMRNHYPAIDVLASISRVMNEIVTPEHQQAASVIRARLAAYYENFDLISIGAYKPGTNPKIDDAIATIDQINGFLCQGVNEKFTFEQILEQMQQLAT
jgi:flagellum-specific ATP synthase